MSEAATSTNMDTQPTITKKPGDNRKVVLTSCDNAIIETTVGPARSAKFLENTLNLDEDEDEDGDNQKPFEPIPVTRVDGETLKAVVKYLEHYYEEPMNKIVVPFMGETLNEVRY